MKEPTESKQCSHFLQTANRHLVRLWVLVNGALAVNATPPSIAYQAKEQSVILYQQAAFGVIASGSAPLTYQWRRDGVPIAGATNDQIVIAHVQFSDAGAYSVVVSNAENSVTSADATLTVKSPKAGDVDCSFACGSSINGTVGSIAVRPDGTVLIAGDFSTVNGAVRSGIARLNPDGTTDYTFVMDSVRPLTNDSSFSLTLHGTVPGIYVVESSTNLNDWIGLGGGEVVGPTITFGPFLSGGSHQFFRARRE